MENDNISKNSAAQDKDNAAKQPSPGKMFTWMVVNERKVGIFSLLALCAIIAVGVIIKTHINAGTDTAPVISPETYLASATELYEAREYEKALKEYEKYEIERLARPDLPKAALDWLPKAKSIVQAREQGRAITPALAKAASGAKSLHPFNSGVSVIEADGAIKFVRADGSISTPRHALARPFWDRQFRNGLLCVGIENEGYITTEGQQLDGFQAWRYDECYPFYDERALVKEKASGLYGYISPDGSLSIEPKYDAAKPFHEGRAFARRDGRWYVIDTDGKEYSSFANTSYTDGPGEASGLYDGVAIVGNEDGEPILINLRGEQMDLNTNDVNGRPAAFSEGLRAFRGDDGKYGYESLGTRVAPVVIKPKFASAYNFYDGVAIVGDGKRYFGLTDKTGRLCVPYRYDQLSRSSDSLVVFGAKQAGGKMRYGVITHRGDIVHPCVYDSIAPFAGGFAVARKGYKLGYLDHYGLSTFDWD